jgi:predicted O-linked N-acetylglucosamine transferase (SPINDLY family)
MTEAIATIQTIQEFLQNAQYEQVIRLCEQALQTEESQSSYCCYLGIALLLLGQEEEAQTTWFMLFLSDSEDQHQQNPHQLAQILDHVADTFEKENKYLEAWLIRQHFQQIFPDEISNLLKLTGISLNLNRFQTQDLAEWNLLNLIGNLEPVRPELDLELLLTISCKLMLSELAPGVIKQWLDVCDPLYQMDTAKAVHNLLGACYYLASFQYKPQLACEFVEHLWHLIEGSSSIGHAINLYAASQQYTKALELARQGQDNSRTPEEWLASSYVLIKTLIATGGHWRESAQHFANAIQALDELLQGNPDHLSLDSSSSLVSLVYLQPYFRDTVQACRARTNHVATLFQSAVRHKFREKFNHYQRCLESRKKTLASSFTSQDRKIRVGYLSHCLRLHSIGWLVRWLFDCHDKEKFEVYAYLIGDVPKVQDPIQSFITTHASQSYFVPPNILIAADRISEDKIDILIDLDSLTYNLSLGVMALQPALLQMSWLGFDASGLPAIHYFIADQHTVPTQVQQYYNEKIITLPRSFIATKGFEIGTPSISRDTLQIPNDAVIYLSIQNGLKLNEQSARLQAKILSRCPNSYLILKVRGALQSVQESYSLIVAEMGIDVSRIKYLPPTATEAEHRANISAIADVVLDTYPYNGATTTMETLWACVPIVTRVGEQFSSRTTYSMLRNAGIDKIGIAWSDEEYVDWAVKLGESEELRREVHTKLRESHHTSPLWQVDEFTRDLEAAYLKAWQTYLQEEGRLEIS